DFWGLSGSCSRRGREVTLTVTNPSLSEPRETEVVIRGRAMSAVRVTTLAAGNVHDVNSFERPDAVRPITAEVPARDVNGVFRFPAASVTKLGITLAS
ncbi:MAG TPA: alpha-L-arabinofuranosidase C-terminal domain-containing protein, partial [Gemmatimonadales bacterium]